MFTLANGSQSTCALEKAGMSGSACGSVTALSRAAKECRRCSDLSMLVFDDGFLSLLSVREINFSG